MGYYCDKCEEYFSSPFYCIHWYAPEAPALRRIKMFAQNDETTDMDELNREQSREDSDVTESDSEPDSTLGEDTDVDEDEEVDE